MANSFLCMHFVYALDYCRMIIIFHLHEGKSGDVQKIFYCVCD